MKFCTELLTNNDGNLFSQINNFLSKINGTESLTDHEKKNIAWNRISELLYQHIANGDHFTIKYEIIDNLRVNERWAWGIQSVQEKKTDVMYITQC